MIGKALRADSERTRRDVSLSQTAGGGSNPCWSTRESQVRPAERQRAPTTKKKPGCFTVRFTVAFLTLERVSL